MKRILFSLTALALFMNTTAYARDTWRGMLVIKTASAGCENVVPGSEFTVRYAPRTTANGSNSAFTLFGMNDGDWAQAYELVGREFDATLRPVQYNAIYAVASSIPAKSTNPPAPKVAFTSIARTPGATETTTATEFIQISGSIVDFHAIYYKGCNMTFRMSLVRDQPI